MQKVEISSLSDKIKNNGQWKVIIKTKVDYDYGDDDRYPRTYEYLMMRNNSSLHTFLMDIKNKNQEKRTSKGSLLLDYYIGIFSFMWRPTITSRYDTIKCHNPHYNRSSSNEQIYLMVPPPLTAYLSRL